ncbi:uncharacterized protein LOC132553053 [Ylistrum balloti]|uniref:uncharacterized protein LOC132553053 n=1 Tax=Ylistrum balloti TaxID=509963 RepID=UPI002905C4B1|nr:uncharacterized protein LOC132553053 [Ylistrum balloti]
MDFYKWCSVLCQLWLLPSWITTKTLPEVVGENVTSQLDILETSSDLTTISNSNVTENYETISSATTVISSKTTTLSRNTKIVNPDSKISPSLRDFTTKPSFREENITAVIDKTSENKSSFGGYTTVPPSDNSSVVTETSQNVSVKITNVTEGQKRDNMTNELEGFRETTSVIYTTVEIDKNSTSVNITTPLNIKDFSKTTPYMESENDTSANGSSSISPLSSTNSMSKTDVTSSSKKKKPFVWTTPHPNVIRHMWLAKRARSRTHTGSLHHLSLVPIEDGPFGSLIWKDKKYLITVLVPIGIGIIGAVCIISMAYVVRFCHRHERKMQEIRETIQKRYSNQNDQVILLTNSSDDEF